MTGLRLLKGLGCIAGGGAALGILAAMAGAAIAIWVAFDPFGNPFARWLGADNDTETTELPGDARAFDPFSARPAVQDYAGQDARLVSIAVSLVRSDGTLDLKAAYTPQPEVTYTFMRPVSRPGNAPPPGAGGTNAGEWFEEVEVRAYEPGQRRQVTTTTGNSRTTFHYTNKGMERTVSEPAASTPAFVDPPSCAIKDLWAAAIAQGAPSDAVARITYDTDGYRFAITGFALQLQFDGSCALIADD